MAKIKGLASLQALEYFVAGAQTDPPTRTVIPPFRASASSRSGPRCPCTACDGNSCTDVLQEAESLQDQSFSVRIADRPNRVAFQVSGPAKLVAVHVSD